jgi:hypothetical protein
MAVDLHCLIEGNSFARNVLAIGLPLDGSVDLDRGHVDECE